MKRKTLAQKIYPYLIRVIEQGYFFVCILFFKELVRKGAGNAPKYEVRYPLFLSVRHKERGWPRQFFDCESRFLINESRFLIVFQYMVVVQNGYILNTATQYEYIRERLSSVGFCIVPLLNCIVPLLKTLRAAPCLFCTNVPIVPLIFRILAEIRLSECQRRLILFSSSNYFSYDFIYKQEHQNSHPLVSQYPRLRF